MKLEGAVCDSGPLMALAKVDGLRFLGAVCPDLIVPAGVRQECVVLGQERGEPDAAAIEAFLGMGNTKIVKCGAPVSRLSSLALGRGELEVLSLAVAKPGRTALLDDLSAREAARALGIPARGTLGLLALAHRDALLGSSELTALVRLMTSRDDIWLDKQLCEKFLDELLRR